MKSLKEQVVELNKNQNHVLEAIKDLNERLEHLEDIFKDDKLNNLQEIIESQEIIDGIIVKNADDMIPMKKKKEQNEESIKYLEEKMYTIDKVIATMTQNLQDQFERLREEVADNDTKVNDDIIHKIKCKYFDTGFCRLKDKCPFSHKSPKICEAYKKWIKEREAFCSTTDLQIIVSK